MVLQTVSVTVSDLIERESRLQWTVTLLVNQQAPRNLRGGEEWSQHGCVESGQRGGGGWRRITRHPRCECRIQLRFDEPELHRVAGEADSSNG